jgi:hypothetical protein
MTLYNVVERLSMLEIRIKADEHSHYSSGVSLKKLAKLEPSKNGKFVGLTNAIGESRENRG